MSKPSSNYILGFDGTSTDSTDIILQPMILPYPLNLLIVCSNASIEQGLTSYFSLISNCKVEFCSSLSTTIDSVNQVILVLDDNAALAKSMVEKLSDHNMSFIILGDNIQNELIRIVIHYKVKDIISIADIEKELYSSLLDVSNNLINTSKIAPVFTVINGKAGSGASFVTSCLAEISANLSADEIAIVDADLNYGTLADTFNFEPSYFISDALEELEKLDNTAIKSMMLKRDNLSLLASEPYTLLNKNAYILEQLPQLMWKIKLNHDLVLVDLSRGLDPHAVPLINLSDKVLIVVQQNILSLRETKVLIQQLTTNMGIPNE